MELLRKHTLLLVEGKDEKQICELLLFKINPEYINTIDVQSTDGGDDLLAEAQAIDIQSGFKTLKTLAIVCDAEETPQDTVQRWANFKAQFEVQHPSKECLYLVLPTEHQTGAIDSVFINSLDVKTNQLAACALNFAACVGAQGAQTTQARRDKLALTSYINAHTKNPYSRVGMAISQDAKTLFDFEHSSFATLRVFLSNLIPKTVPTL